MFAMHMPLKSSDQSMSRQNLLWWISTRNRRIQRIFVANKQPYSTLVPILISRNIFNRYQPYATILSLYYLLIFQLRSSLHLRCADVSVMCNGSAFKTVRTPYAFPYGMKDIRIRRNCCENCCRNCCYL